MGSDSWVEADTLDNGTGVEAFDFGVGVEFVEIADAKCEVGISEKFDSLCLGEPHIKGWDILLDGTLLKESSESVGTLFEEGTIGEAVDGIVELGVGSIFRWDRESGDDARGI